MRMCMMLSALSAAVSERSTFGPSETSCAPPRSSANSSGANPPSGPTTNAAARRGPLAAAAASASSSRIVHSGRSSHANTCEPTAPRALCRHASTPVKGGSTSGTLSRPHCSAASTAVARSLSRLTSRTTVRAVTSGWSACTPSSVAFSTRSASRFGLSSAKWSDTASVGPSCGRVCSSGVDAHVLRPVWSTVASHSPLMPSKSSTGSRSRTRITDRR
mmetsp:Transcript_13890/g.43398  ORF Transcript_13890/g.43398 Transcript_13890/m.43398 type:complete len:218 (-) Transcript_13890:166-819(-)